MIIWDLGWANTALYGGVYKVWRALHLNDRVSVFLLVGLLDGIEIFLSFFFLFLHRDILKAKAKNCHGAGSLASGGSDVNNNGINARGGV